MNRDIIKQRYQIQKGCAKRRGIDFEFTYEQWIAWWGDDIVNRGRGAGKLVMARHNDVGDYHPTNVRKATVEENHKEAKNGRKGKTLTAEHKMNLSIAKKQYYATQCSLNITNILETQL